MPWLLLAATLSAPVLESQPFQLRAYHGKERQVQKVTLTVPADYAHPSARTVTIAAYVFSAKRPTSAPPIVFLMGGPGIPGTVLAPVPPYFDLFDRLSEEASVVVLDQRGLGESTPKVDCPPAAPPAPDVFGTKAKMLAAFQALNAACAAHWRKASVEPGDFAIEQVADDVESLRAALQAKQVDLLAFSYGTRIAVEVMRRHPAAVRKAVWQGVLASTIRMPNLDDQTFQALAAVADAQAAVKGFAPGLMQNLHDAQRQFPLFVTARAGDGRDVRLAVGREVFDAIVASRLGDRRLPAMLAMVRRGDTTVLAQWVEGMYQDLEKGSAPLMRAAVVCSAAEDRRAAQAARRLGPTSLLGEPFDNLLQGEAYCKDLGVAGVRAAPARIRSAASVLMISGSLDDRTPPRPAEALRDRLERSQHVVVKNGGHELLPEPQVQDAVVAFLRDGLAMAPAIELPPPDFPDVEAAKTPPRRR